MDPIPGIGEHTRAILKELAVPESTVAKLLADKAI
jgi:crotonobetainyl-CoA:carnitine CoA-transferase CaiB-like acyl-CoA transferase